MHLFGTDGVRGKAGEYPLDVTTIRRLGAALVRAMRQGQAAGASGIRFLSGRDTRESGGWIERELAFGAQSQGGVPTFDVAHMAEVVTLLVPFVPFKTRIRRRHSGTVGEDHVTH